MAPFITVQVIRTAESRKRIQQAIDILAQVVEEEQAASTLVEQVSGAKEPGGPVLVQLGMLTNVATIHKMANVLLNHIWC